MKSAFRVGLLRDQSGQYFAYSINLEEVVDIDQTNTYGIQYDQAEFVRWLTPWAVYDPEDPMSPAFTVAMSSNLHLPSVPRQS